MGVVTSIVALGVAAAAAGKSISDAKRAKKHDKKANRAQMQINRLKNRQVKRTFLRGFRQAQANNISLAVASGVDIESSRTQGTLGSEQTQKGVALGEFNEQDRLSTKVANQKNRAAGARFDSGVAGQVSSFASSFISFGS